MTFARWIVLLFVLVQAGCTTSSVDGDVTTYKNSIPAVLGLTTIAIAFLVFGVGIAKESWEAIKPKRKSRSKKRKRRSHSRTSAPSKKAVGGIVIGGLLTLIGGIILLLGIPSQLLAHITLSPDKVIIRDDLFWFSHGAQEFPFSSISNFDHEEYQEIARRGTRKKEIWYITHTGGTERIEMVPLHKAARAQVEQAWSDYYASGGQTTPMAANQEATSTDGIESNGQHPTLDTVVAVHTDPTPREADSPEPEMIPTPEGLTPVDRLGRYAVGKVVMARNQPGPTFRAEVLEVYKEGKVQVRMTYGPDEGSIFVVPLHNAHISASAKVARPGDGPGRQPASVDELQVGMTALGHYDGDWLPIKIVNVRGEKPVIIFEGEKAQSAVPLSWVRIPD